MKTLNTLIPITLVIFFTFLIMKYASTRSYYSHDHPILNKVRENFSKIDPKFSQIPLREGDSAYTENKEVITLCLKDPENKGTYYDMNTIMYVAIHELAHVCCESSGHGEEFKKKFSALLRHAANIGIYDPRKGIPSSYCGLNQN